MRFLALTSLLLTGCASLSTRLPEVPEAAFKSEQVFQEQQLFAQMQTHQARLARISSKILKANTDLCKKTGPDIGAVTHTLKSYSKKLQPAAAREVGATKDPRVSFVRAGSPAARAGVKPGDYLGGPDGKALHSPGKALRTYVEQGAILKLKSGGQTRPVTFALETACAYPARLKMSSAINAYANGKTITVTAGMMDFVKSDDELAAIIGHELAHNELGHIRKSITNYALSLGGTRFTRPFESEADYAGLYYMSRAGFNMDNVEDMWRRLARRSGRPIARAKTHPTFPDRYVRLAAARKEIERKRAAGDPLKPNLKDGS